jgi:hypothetical protein
MGVPPHVLLATGYVDTLRLHRACDSTSLFTPARMHMCRCGPDYGWLFARVDVYPTGPYGIYSSLCVALAFLMRLLTFTDGGSYCTG